ncbi:chromate efflux transporter [Paenibacillus thalictri]|uniref:Chromate efflux transporter n=1 Tax=Paenibacillus thalictri TaxID=2527873 RepID=A0A4Q9DSZ2_9BACL|nr:chromate efflux transporter [Paenibacillus thalictri]TBL78619.1 chromate efflux transporter [Paenibacillus thalictri]
MYWKSLVEILRVSLKLGLTSFGGPIAHLGYFHNEYIRKRKWMDERSYADLVALCQLLPGPASSQVGIGIGTVRAGLLGGVVSWIGFTAPSVIVLTLFALLTQAWHVEQSGWIHGLKIVAVVIVAQAVLGMGQKLATGRNRMTIAAAAAAIVLLWQSAAAQIVVILLAAAAGYLLFKDKAVSDESALHIPVSRTTGVVCIVLFAALLLGLPLLRSVAASQELAVLDSFYRAGSLVFGGGHVVLPLLEKEVVPAGWVSKESFLAGYGAAQAVPGPLFTFAAYLGAVHNGIGGALLATIGIFLPAYLLVIGALPFWGVLRTNPNIQGALAGVNAAVVGILLASLYNPIWTSAILVPADFALALVLFVLLIGWKLPPWVIVAAGAAGGALIAAV